MKIMNLHLLSLQDTYKMNMNKSNAKNLILKLIFIVFFRFAANRPRFGSFGSTTSTTTTTTTPAPKPSAASTSRSRFRATPAQSQRLDVVANILNKPPPPRPLDRSFSSARTSSLNNDKKPVPSSSEAPSRR